MREIIAWSYVCVYSVLWHFELREWPTDSENSPLSLLVDAKYPPKYCLYGPNPIHALYLAHSQTHYILEGASGNPFS